MELEKVKEQLNSIIKAIAIVIGEITAIEEEQRNTKEQDRESVKSPQILKKEGDYMYTIKDTKVRMHGRTYEVRFRKLGFDLSTCGKTLTIAQEKMKEKLKDVNKQVKNKNFVKKEKAVTVESWSNIYLNKYKKMTLCEYSFKEMKRTVNLHVIKKFGTKKLKDVKSLELQEYFLELIESGKTRTAEKMKTYINGMFDMAVKNNLIRNNPMIAVVVPKHYRKHGTALTYEEEMKFIEDIKGNYYEDVFKFILYTGTRKSEVEKFKLSDVDFEKNTLIIHTTKVKDTVNGADRTVPIFPYLKPVLEKIVANAEEEQPLRHYISRCGAIFKKFLPNHHLHELRHTFTTHCRECGIDLELTSLWTGHAFEGNTTSAVYTHYSMEFQQKQAEKLRY